MPTVDIYKTPCTMYAIENMSVEWHRLASVPWKLVLMSEINVEVASISIYIGLAPDYRQFASISID